MPQSDSLAVAFSPFHSTPPLLARQNFSEFLVIPPFERADLPLARIASKHGVSVAVDIGRDPTVWDSLFNAIKHAGMPNVGLRIPDNTDLRHVPIPASIPFLVVAGDCSLIPATWSTHPVIAQVTSLDEAVRALSHGVVGLVSKGSESGGLTSEESSFILLQRIIAHVETLAEPVPVWCQGGMGWDTVASAFAGGAFGVVIDSMLAGLPECSLPEEVKQRILSMDGSEVKRVGGYQVLPRSSRDALDLDSMTAGDVRELLARKDSHDLLAVGQDGALAKCGLDHSGSFEALLRSLKMHVAGQFRQAKALGILAQGNAWAASHGTRYPIAQGPMTRVSDTAAFCHAVAHAGALPFLALSLMDAQACARLLDDTRARLGNLPWGVGVLGFAPPEVLNPQLDLIKQYKPAVVLLAGGRPSQARPLIDLGISTYLHVPSPGLLDLFLKDGAEHFVFEGRECGGHVGPRYSMVLWQQALDQLLKVEHPERLHVLFAGGIHDARSSAMVAAMAAPLAALGAKIGVLMGTAYIATQEAVSCQAVLPQFQSKSLLGMETVLVETAPGHAIRCLDSGFVAYFEREKVRLRDLGLDQKQIWLSLEKLTVGRLRIASKGIERNDSGLVHVNGIRQDAEGMYMIGQAIALKTEVIGIAELHESVSLGSTRHLAALKPPVELSAQYPDPVAIVGMACLYPGSPDLEAYWANILQRRDLIQEVPKDRWNVDQYFQAGGFVQGKSPSRWGGFVDDTPFDPLVFGIPPQSLAAIEPVQLLSLKVAHEALRDANYLDRYFDRQKTAVIFGAESGTDLANQYTFRNLFPQYCGDLPAALDAVLPKLTEDSFPGVLVNVIAGRIANRLGLGGVNYSVDSACASSLTAIELGVKELRSGSSDMVLAGGADFHNGIADFLMFASVGALSGTGRCRAFDSTADGIVLGEGVGVVVLKRLSDAQADGDRIYAVIDGIAGSSDGKGLGLTAPRKEGQKRSLERAYWQAGKLPADVGLVEAHGTGTVVGDRTELKTLCEIYTAGGALAGQAGLGSVKSQIGHTKCAAGVAGLIKVAKALHHGVLPATLHVSKPNAGHSSTSSPFVIGHEIRPWTASQACAAVSAFGFGGANFHAVLSPYSPHRSHWGALILPCELFAFRGESMSDAKETMRLLQSYLAQTSIRAPLADLAQAVWLQRPGVVQCAFVASDLPELHRLLGDAMTNSNPSEVHFADTESGKVAFLFSGQGSQYPGMLRDFFVYFQAAGSILARSPAYTDIVFPRDAHSELSREAGRRALMDTRNAQPALGLVEMALFDWLQALGCLPDMVAGHSFGELSALFSAGAYSADDLVRLAQSRAMAILQAAGDDPGAMAAVGMDAGSLGKLLKVFPDVALANQNSPEQTVISGPSPAILAACEHLRQQGVASKRIDTACAFHSPVVAAAQQLFASALEEISMGPLRWPVYSNTTAAPYATEARSIRDLLALHVASPVRFVDQVRQMYADGARVFVEIGPKQVLRGLVGKILKGQVHRSIALDDERGGLRAQMDAVAALAVRMPSFTAEPLFKGRARSLDLSSPKLLPQTTWMVNGGRAWPLTGSVPEHAARLVAKPVAVFSTGDGQHSDATPLSAGAEQALMSYLANMREIVHAQRDVLQSYFDGGNGASAPRTQVDPVAIELASIPVDGVASVARVAAPERAPIRLDPESALLSIVSERTGYPVEMLDLDLDLEADLSIDSIKRIEIIGELAKVLTIRERLGQMADQLLERLAVQKTLRSVLAGLPAQLQEEQPVPLPQPGLSVSELLLDIVSASTGYPKDVLDMDLDLEADLSIDSIKRLEVVSQLATRLGFNQTTAGRDRVLEGLAPMKTLRAMLAWLEKGPPRPSENATASSGHDQQSSSVRAMAPPMLVNRYVIQPFACPPDAAGSLDLLGARIMITDDQGGLASRLFGRLVARGARPVLLDFLAYREMGTATLDAFDGIVHLWPLNTQCQANDIKCFFSMLKDCLERPLKFVFAAGMTNGVMGSAPLSDAPQSAAGVSGLLKTIAHEHRDTRVRMIHLDPGESQDIWAQWIEDELLADGDAVDVERKVGRRDAFRVVPKPLKEEVSGGLPLTSSSVVLLTGGARGITAQVAIDLARRYRCHLEIVGRSKPPEWPESDLTRSLDDARDVRRALLASNPSFRPAEIERMTRELLGGRELVQTMALIEKAGATVAYTSLDVCKEAEFGGFIESVYRQHGRIDAVFHGAGVIDDKLVRDKSIDSFCRVFDTKTKSAKVLFEAVRDDVKLVVFFSSVASVFGNRGQADYAAANDVLDKLALRWQRRIGDKARVLSVNWGPWSGAGMVSESLEKEYARRGVGLIPQDQGVAALMRELQSGQGVQVLLVGGQAEAFSGKNNTAVVA